MLELNLLCMTAGGKSVEFSAQMTDIETEDITNG